MTEPGTEGGAAHSGLDSRRKQVNVGSYSRQPDSACPFSPPPDSVVSVCEDGDSQCGQSRLHVGCLCVSRFVWGTVSTVGN